MAYAVVGDYQPRSGVRGRKGSGAGSDAANQAEKDAAKKNKSKKQKKEQPTFKELSIQNPKSGRSASLNGGLVEWSYYESILSNHITSTLIIADSGNAIGEGKNRKDILNGLPIRGGEPVRIRCEDIRGHELRFVGTDGAFYVNRVKDVLTDPKNTIMTMDLCTKEFIANEQTRVVKRYSGKISESARKIATESLQTTKPLDIEETSNSYNFIGNIRKPFFTLTWLAAKSIPSDGAYGKTAGYFFFETQEGFQYKSIETLVGPTKGGGSADSKNAKKYEFTLTDKVRSGYEKILQYNLNQNIDLQEKLAVGAYNSRFLFFNPYTYEVKHSDFAMDKDQDGKVRSAGTELSFVAKEFRQGPTRGISSVLDVGTLPSGEDARKQVEQWKKKKDETNDRVQERSVQAITRYNQLFSISVDILIDADFSLKAGDTIYCEFPELAAETKRPSKETSGLYLIASVCHKVAPAGSYTSLNLIRDSFGKKRS